MILPSKHINFSQSLLGFGAYILKQLDTSKSIDEVWENYLEDYTNDIYFAKHTFDNLILTLVYLFNIGVIVENDGVVKKCD